MGRMVAAAEANALSWRSGEAEGVGVRRLVLDDLGEAEDVGFSLGDGVLEEGTDIGEDLGVGLGLGVVAGNGAEGVGVLLVMAAEQLGDRTGRVAQLRGGHLVRRDGDELEALGEAGDLGVGQ